MSSPADLLVEGPAVLPHLARLFRAYATMAPSQQSRLSEAARQQRAAWRRIDALATALPAAGFSADTAALLDSLRDGGPIPAFAAAEILGSRPESVPALRALITEPAGEWLVQQRRWGRIARVAEALGPVDGEPLLAALWAETDGAHRDVHYAIERCLLAWGPAAGPFLSARLAAQPQRVRTVVSSLVSRWGWAAPAALRRGGARR